MDTTKTQRPMDRGRPRPPPRSFGARAGQRLRKRDIPGGRGRPRSINICVRLHACMSRSDAERGLLSIFLPPFTGDVRPKAGMGALQAPKVPPSSRAPARAIHFPRMRGKKEERFPVIPCCEGISSNAERADCGVCAARPFTRRTGGYQAKEQAKYQADNRRRYCVLLTRKALQSLAYFLPAHCAGIFRG